MLEVPGDMRRSKLAVLLYVIPRKRVYATLLQFPLMTRLSFWCWSIT